MKLSTTRFLSVFFSISLALTSLGTHASDENEARELPSFYFVEERDNGQTFRISTCYQRAVTNAGAWCPTVTDVDRDDVNQFLADVNSTRKANRKYHDRFAFGILGAIVSGFGTFIAVVHSLDKKSLTGKKGLFLIFMGIIGVTGGLTINKYNEGSSVYLNSGALKKQIRSGIITGRMGNEKATRRILEQFEAFLQEYGRTVETEHSAAAPTATYAH